MPNSPQIHPLVRVVNVSRRVRRSRAARALGSVLRSQYLLVALTIVVTVLYLHSSRELSHTNRRIAQSTARDTARNAAQDTVNAQTREQAVNGCRRLQTIDAVNNVNALQAFEILQAVVSAGTGPPAIKMRAEQALARFAWTPNESCESAVDKRGIHYRLPAPVPFTVMLPSPKDLRPPVPER